MRTKVTSNNFKLDILENQHNMYQQPNIIEKYLYQSHLPELKKFTICFWVKLDPFDKGKPTIVSIATESEWLSKIMNIIITRKSLLRLYLKTR